MTEIDIESLLADAIRKLEDGSPALTREAGWMLVSALRSVAPLVAVPEDSDDELIDPHGPWSARAFHAPVNDSPDHWCVWLTQGCAASKSEGHTEDSARQLVAQVNGSKRSRTVEDLLMEADYDRAHMEADRLGAPGTPTDTCLSDRLGMIQPTPNTPDGMRLVPTAELDALIDAVEANRITSDDLNASLRDQERTAYRVESAAHDLVAALSSALPADRAPLGVERCRFPENGGGGHVEYCDTILIDGVCIEHGLRRPLQGGER